MSEVQEEIFINWAEHTCGECGWMKFSGDSKRQGFCRRNTWCEETGMGHCWANNQACPAFILFPSEFILTKEADDEKPDNLTEADEQQEEDESDLSVF